MLKRRRKSGNGHNLIHQNYLSLSYFAIARKVFRCKSNNGSETYDLEIYCDISLAILRAQSQLHNH